jgi:hypothetical protein
VTPADPLPAPAAVPAPRLPARATGREHRYYDAYMSYNRTADKALARALRRRLLRVGVPWWRRSPRHVYLSRRQMESTPSLPPTVQRALRAASHLVLLASDRRSDRDHGSAGSTYMRKEVAFWLEQCGGTPDRVLIVHTRGATVGAALPWMSDRVVSRTAAQVDLRRAHNEGRPVRAGRFDTAVARLIAAL